MNKHTYIYFSLIGAEVNRIGSSCCGQGTRHIMYMFVCEYRYLCSSTDMSMRVSKTSGNIVILTGALEDTNFLKAKVQS